MRGMILAGGMGTRLHPVTKVVTKQLLPVYDKPMIYYPLSTLMLAGIKDILIICKPEDELLFKKLLGTGQDIGINLQYKVQFNPNGIAESFILGEDFIGDDDVCLILGDNIFYGHDLPLLLQKGVSKIENRGGAVIFGYHVNNPQDYGVVKCNKKGRVINIEEKPKRPKTNCAAVGLYMYDNSVVEVAKTIKPSARGEVEITAVNNDYVKNKNIELVKLGRGYTWFDMGSSDSFLNASNYVQTIQKRQGLKISCIEETSYNMNFINTIQLEQVANTIKNQDYKNYLLDIIRGDA
tara:strand:+ start:26746 stop:27627 length:882 start_codon:yes stop_codon:yes gene_type:complete